MSILIRGMEMPESCGLCSFEHEAYFLCVLTKSNTLEAHKNYKRMDDCPLVEVPPHGRLIDAAELQQDIHMHHYILTDVWHSRDNGMFTNGIDYAISVAPTIIEAERRERK